jgi:hypothetical protein
LNNTNPPQAVTSRELKLTENPFPLSTESAMTITYLTDLHGFL